MAILDDWSFNSEAPKNKFTKLLQIYQQQSINITLMYFSRKQAFKIFELSVLNLLASSPKVFQIWHLYSQQ